MKASTGFIMVAFWCRSAVADCTVSNDGECEENQDDVISSIQVKSAKRSIVRTPTHGMNWTTIICPFLANMVKHGFLEIKPNYNAEELFDLTVANGLPQDFVEGHNMSNFAPFPTGKINIFDMEGIATEHTTSTGINDCPSLFPTKAEDKNICPIDCVTGAPKCPTPNKDCLTKDHKEKEYNRYIELVDVNPKDEILTVPELLAAADAYQTETNDLNLGIQGDIGENPTAIGTSFMALSMVFGESCDGISEKRLKKVLFEKELPEDFVFPRSNRCDPFEFIERSLVQIDAGRKTKTTSQSKVKNPVGFNKISGGYCNSFEGTEETNFGMGVFDVTPGETNLDECASICNDRPPCMGFNSAPDVAGHTKCHLFSRKPISADEQFGWLCYAKSAYKVLGFGEKCEDKDVITDEAECEDASRALGLYSPLMDVIRRSEAPFGCVYYVEEGSFASETPLYNIGGGNTVCEHYKPICKNL